MIGVTATLGICTLANADPMHMALLAVGAVVASKLPDQAEIGVIPHRGPTHRPELILGWAVVAALCVQTWPLWGLLGVGVALGYTLHLLADALTLDGIPFPLSFRKRKRLHLLPDGIRFEVGDPPEYVFAFFVALGMVALMYAQAGIIERTYS